MKKAPYLLLLLVLLPFSKVLGQFTKTIYLKPIEMSFGPRYFYGGKPVRSFEALQVPLMEVNDAGVNRFVRSYRTIRSVGTLMAFVPLVYTLANLRQSYNPNTFWAIYLGSVATSVSLNALSNQQARRAIIRYNLVISEASTLNFSLEQLPQQQTAGVLSWHYNF